MAEPKKKIKLPEKETGTTLFNIDPIIIRHPYSIVYIHSYAQDSPFFKGLTEKKLLSTKCKDCGYVYGTPKTYCMECGGECEWIELPLEGKVHCWTTCHFGSEEFLPETPFNLILVEFEGVNTLFLARLIGIEEKDIKVGMKIKAQFLRNSQFKPTDVYFVPDE